MSSATTFERPALRATSRTRKSRSRRRRACAFLGALAGVLLLALLLGARPASACVENPVPGGQLCAPPIVVTAPSTSSGSSFWPFLGGSPPPASFNPEQGERAATDSREQQELLKKRLQECIDGADNAQHWCEVNDTIACTLASIAAGTAAGPSGPVVGPLVGATCKIVLDEKCRSDYKRDLKSCQAIYAPLPDKSDAPNPSGASTTTPPKPTPEPHDPKPPKDCPKCGQP